MKKELSKIYIVPTDDGRHLLMTAKHGDITLLYGDSKPIKLSLPHTQFLAHVLNDAIKEARD